MSWKEILHPSHELMKIMKFPPPEKEEVSQISQIHIDKESIKYAYEERAAILEYEANIPKEEAERLAYQECLVEFMQRYYPDAVKQFNSIVSAGE